MANLPNFLGEVHHKDDTDYDFFRYQYAYSSHGGEGGMDPAAIIYPKSPTADADVRSAIAYAVNNGIAIAVRTGGHQYSGASSTSGRNILLDLSEAYMEFDWNEDTRQLRLGVSYSLADMNAELGKRGLFVPHGQCYHVHVGGHAQTGGYGQLGRSFGLLSDYIVGIRVITADGVVHEISRSTTDEKEAALFYAMLGGSPGNYAVLTHIILQPLHDSDHPNSRGMKVIAEYKYDTVLALLKLMAEMVADDDFPADHDFCISVLSQGQKILPQFDINQIDSFMRTWNPEEYGGETKRPPSIWPAAIILYVQWANLEGKGQVYDPAWFQKIREATSGSLSAVLVDDKEPTPMSVLTSKWVFQDVREFDMPYNKRCYVTNSTTLGADKWPEYTADRIKEIESDVTNGCKLAVQIQHFGGKHSRFRNNDAEGKTAFRHVNKAVPFRLRWRDTSVVCVLDCFYDPEDVLADAADRKPKEISDEWVAHNDKSLKGPSGVFSKDDRRVLWGSYYANLTEKNWGMAWPFYHENQAKYNRLCEIKREVDPHKVFTPNEFCVDVEKPTDMVPSTDVITADPVDVPKGFARALRIYQELARVHKISSNSDATVQEPVHLPQLSIPTLLKALHI
eukprot:jgi/Chlat1/2932/Chrsp2S08906